jgi:hypothetical protein
MTDRRLAVPFDPDYFSRLASSGQALDSTQAFRHAYRTNLWSGPESRSGPGSGLEQTQVLRAALPELCRRRKIRSLLDVPCGDWCWMASVDLAGIEYTGGDLLEELVEENQRVFGGPGRRFQRLDLTASVLPGADLLLCRDCLVHLSAADVSRALANIRRSDISYLLATTFPAEPENREIVTGDWRPVNLEARPFSLPPPLELIVERCTEAGGRFPDKSLGLWGVADLPV